ncbi:MAG: matrixin family metalloprotease [Bradymonadaceae bacterium]
MTNPQNAFIAACLAMTGAAIMLSSAPAFAFVQTMTCYPSGQFRCDPGETPKPVQWPKLEVHYTVNEQGSDDLHEGLITNELMESITASFETWNEPECSNLELINAGLTDREEIGFKDHLGDANLNLVVWRDDDWPYGSYAAVALTTVTFRPSTGFIVDADIEMNGAMYTYTDVDNPDATLVDVRNTLTHEVGHFIGLDHTSERNATMFGTAAPAGELSKRTLHSVDIAGLCHIYPEGGVPPDVPPVEEEPSSRRWCAAAPPAMPLGPESPALILLLAAAALWARRRS